MEGQEGQITQKRPKIKIAKLQGFGQDAGFIEPARRKNNHI